MNIGSGKPISILGVADVLLKLYGSTMKTVVEHKFRAGDVRHCSSDISKARNEGEHARMRVPPELRAMRVKLRRDSR